MNTSRLAAGGKVVTGNLNFNCHCLKYSDCIDESGKLLPPSLQVLMIISKWSSVGRYA